jgi:hypothetical protein
MISILVPYRSDDARRDQLWDWIHQRLAALVPDGEIVVGTCSDGPFNRSEAVNAAASLARGDILLIADADMAIDRAWLHQAIEACQAGQICYHRWIHYLSETDSNAILSRAPDADLSVPIRTEYSSMHSWGGVCMLPRPVFNHVRGMDARFIGWGPEDLVFALALSTLWRPPARPEGDLIHLWHPAPPTSRPWGEGQHELLLQYQAAVGDPAAMRAVVDAKPPVQ